MSFLAKVSAFFHGAAVKVSDLFIKLFGKDAAEKFGHDALLLLKSDLGKIVTEVVHEVSLMPNLAGRAAQSEAFARILETAKASGLEARTSIINLLIELALNALRGNFTPA